MGQQPDFKLDRLDWEWKWFLSWVIESSVLISSTKEGDSRESLECWPLASSDPEEDSSFAQTFRHKKIRKNWLIRIHWQLLVDAAVPWLFSSIWLDPFVVATDDDASFEGRHFADDPVWSRWWWKMRIYEFRRFSCHFYVWPSTFRRHGMRQFVDRSVPKCGGHGSNYGRPACKIVEFSSLINHLTPDEPKLNVRKMGRLRNFTDFP